MKTNPVDQSLLTEVARQLVAPGKGILAADESTPTIEKRFKSIGVESTEESRRDYRSALFSTPGLGEFISGVILYDETLRQRDAQGQPLLGLLTKEGILPGIKVDKGAKALAGFPGEKVTEGLDGLRQRLAEYAELGAKFTKWRAVITIGDGIPTRACLRSNAHALARFAALSQEAGLVPIVEPEVLMDGSHTIARCEAVTTTALEAVFASLWAHRVLLEAMLLKPNMIVPGKDCPQQAAPEEIAEATLRCFRRTVPAAVPGIVFLSGGLGDRDATLDLNAINSAGPQPWQLGFSFGRALQTPALDAWAGQAAKVPAAQQALARRARCNSAARSGQYTIAMEES